MGCSCGIYAWHKPHGEFAIVDVRGVSGIVTVWGTLQAYADGVRAEYARVEALGVYKLWTKAKKQRHLSPGPRCRTSAECLCAPCCRRLHPKV